MKKFTVPASLALLFATAILLFAHCKKNPVKDDQYFSTVGKYVAAFTGGSISATDPIRVRFTTAVVGPEKVGTPVDAALFRTEPAIKGGTAIWEDAYTMLLQTSEPLKRGQIFKAKVALAKIFPASKEKLPEFDFEFRIKELDFSIQNDGFATKPSGETTFQGRLVSTENLAETALPQLLTATQNGKALPVTWASAPDGLSHSFVVSQVARGESASEVVLDWSGKTLNTPTKGTRKIVVPAIGQFSVLAVNMMDEGQQHLRVNFSDALQTDQNLDGLVQIEGFDGILRTSVSGNDLLIYPNMALEGTQVLLIHAAVRNRAGKALGQTFTQSMDFESSKPRLRLLGQGNIIPSEENGAVLFPFEAVGLRSVDVEIFKIYNSNIPIFLQTSTLNAGYDLERFGKIVLQKTVQLSELNTKATANIWSRYALDLQPLIAKDPGALYQVRLAFRRSYTAIPCNSKDGAAFDDSAELTHLGEADEYGNPSSIFGDYRGIYKFTGSDYYDYDEREADEADENSYSWQNRDNPCRKEYYNEEHFIKRNVFVSNIGLMAKLGQDKSLFIVATDLAKGQPASGVEVAIFDYQLQKMLSVRTNSEGIAEAINVPGRPFLLEASEGKERGYLRLPDGQGLSLSRFDVTGVRAKEGIKGYIYGERGVWRPGDSLFLHFVLEDKMKKLPAGHPINFELTDPRGTLRHKAVSSQHVGGIYALHCSTAPDAPTGNWEAKVSVGGNVFTQRIRIETVKPNRLRMNLDLGGELIVRQPQMTARGKLNWLHGAVGADLPVVAEMQLLSVPTEFNAFKGFVFDDPMRKFQTEFEKVYEGKTDANGAVNIPYTVKTEDGASGRLQARFKVRSFERGGDFSTNSFSVDILPYNYYAGVSIPQGRDGQKIINENQSTPVRFVVVDKAGKPVANRELEAQLFRVDWHWWWDSENDDIYGRYNSYNHSNALSAATLKTDAKGVATWNVTPSRWGRYMIYAKETLEGHGTGDFFWVGYPDNDDDPTSRAAAATLAISSDKTAYQVGEKVTLTVPGGKNSRVLVTLENGSRVLDHFWAETKEGDNAVSFRTIPDMTSTLYAHVTLFQAQSNKENDLPIRMYGVLPIRVEDPKSALQPELAAPKTVRPNEPFTMTVSEKTGRGCAYTLAIVDEGLLDLTSFKTPNPNDHFTAREGLGVQTWDIYDFVLGHYGGTLERIIGIGGDLFNNAKRNPAQASRFKPVIRHIGPFYLKPGEQAKHSIQLDNYVGSVRAMLVCASSGDKSAYGAAEATFSVKQPLMLLPVMPRVLGPGESFRLPVNVFAMEDFVKNAAVSLKSSNGLATVLSGTQNLAFAKQGDQTAYFDIKVGDKTGPARFTFTGTGPNGAKAEHSIDIEIRNPNPIVSTAVAGIAQAKGAWKKAISELNMSDIKGLELEVSAIKPLNLSRHLNSLIQYPYGCVEQVTSAAFPQLYVDALSPLTEKQKAKTTTNITAAIQRLQSYQNANGGFAYWPGNSQVEDYASSYVGHFLLEARKKGYQVSPSMLTKWENYQRNLARTWTETQDNPNNPGLRHDVEFQQAYRLYTLAQAGKPSLPDMNRLRESKNLYSTSAHLLAAAYALAGQAESAKKLINQANLRSYTYDYWGYTYGSNLRDVALRLETSLLVGDQAKAKANMDLVSSALGDNTRWYSTQELATALRAAVNFAAKTGDGGVGLNYSYTIGGKKETVNSKQFISRIDLGEGIGAKDIVIENPSGAPLYISLVASGREAAGQEREQADNLDVTVRYVDAAGAPVNIGQLRRGTDFFAEVTISKKAGSALNFPFKQMALTQVFPSGWEILSSRLQNPQGIGPSVSEYQDIRDDRVMTFFDLTGTNSPKATFKVQLNATYPGRYYLPAVNCEAMYDHRIIGRKGGQWVEVI